MHSVLLIAALALGQTEAAKPALVGEWKLMASEGSELAKQLAANVAIVSIDEGKITAGRTAKYTLNVSKMEIDLVIDGGPKAEQGTYLGVFEASASEAKIHLSLPGKTRASGFKPGMDSVLLVLKRR
jgi:hypothetical protein